ncbi:COX15/CtaA family protein [Methylobacterium aerolatum]|uniref:Heme A synthase n=1 Tax=Methylobacterium aerolatum TaxID=418708 RepID=A0ABU0I3C7_9HYPH|nr:COX15/CtaA family protein [Methylobacterium aerolatum]MDQ0449108.1 cytochrome c oxidase assembly protein subunit 15 [Methylobacterium aerolatum]GJD35296.1 Heme A synthase [Methylobacterium aerolatum]
MGSRTDRIAEGRHASVRLWLFIVAGLVIAMVAVGGATRLTGSGLSITEWRPVTGIVPPLSEADWATEFAKYRDTPQYAILNQGMGLSSFKVLYAWEWGHRVLGRLLGLAFFLPLIVFWWRGMIRRRLGLGLLALGALGGLQGAIGWIMVASGLQPGMTAVAPLKLALHLTTASLILAVLVWLATGEARARVTAAPARLRATALALPVLVLAQIFLGGLVAGSHAGLVYNTWPDMDGVLIPSADNLFAVRPWIENFVDNHLLVQFDHRIVAYLLLALALIHVVDARIAAGGTAVARRATVVAGLVLAQAALGIATLLLAVPLWAALAHQVLAMMVLSMATVHARLCRGVPATGAARTVREAPVPGLAPRGA